MTFKQIEKLLRKDGWYHYDTVGSHLQYKHPTKPREGNNSKAWWRYKKRYITVNLKTGQFKIGKRGKENENSVSCMFL